MTSPSSCISLPRDERPHDAPLEWWYYSGVLQSADALLGFEYATFQMREGGGCRYAAHFAVTDPDAGSYRHAVRTRTGSMAAPACGFALEVDGWRVSGTGDRHALTVEVPGFGLDLTLNALKPAVPQFGTGTMTVGTNRAFHYYSYTRMAVTGAVTSGGSRCEATGSAWMDHQWGELGTAYSGWDWFSLRLDDGTELMLFVVNSDQGYAGGTFVLPDGRYEPLGPSAFAIEVLGRWQSPHTGIDYPQGWAIAVPDISLEVSVTPALPDQEFATSTFESPYYWEGLCEVSGERARTPVGGHAYVELARRSPAGALPPGKPQGSWSSGVGPNQPTDSTRI